MKVSNKKLTVVLRKQSLERLLDEIKMVKTTADLDKFFGKILTKDEKEMILRRITVADMLERKLKYREIEESLSISRLTISKVRDMLEKEVMDAIQAEREFTPGTRIIKGGDKNRF